MSLNYEINPSEPTEIFFGNGSSAETNQEVQIGQFSGLLCDDRDLAEDLVSVNPFMDSGYTLHLRGNDGFLEHPETGERVSIRRDGPRWLVDLEDVGALRTGPARLRAEQAFGAFLKVHASVNSASESQRQRVLRLHERMGHASAESMCDACTGTDSTWSHSGLTASQVRRVMRKDPCLICALGKKNKPPVGFASGDRLDTLRPGDIISGDIIGKISPAAKNGDCYYFLFADVKTGYEHAFTSATKCGFLTALKMVVTWYQNQGFNPHTFRSDSERVLTMGDVANYLKVEHIKPEHSAPYAHWQNFVERYVQTTNKGVATMLHGQRFLKANSWDKALLHWIDCRNRTPNQKCGKKSPHEVITGAATNVSKTFQFVFGDLVAVHIPEELREWKFDLRQDVGIYIGQPDHSVDAGLVYFPYTGKEEIRPNLQLLNVTDEAYQRYFSRRHDIRDPSRSVWREFNDVVGDLEFDFAQPPISDGPMEFRLNAKLAEEEEVPERLQPEQRRKAVIEKSDRALRSSSTASSVFSATSVRGIFDRDKAASNIPEDSFFEYLAVQAMAASASKLSVHDAVKSEDSEHWVKAIRAEVFSMLEKTESLAEEEINYSKPFYHIHSTMQLKKKMKDVVTLDKFKARLCGCGNEIRGLISETFSPTVSTLAHSVLHQLAVIDGMETCTMDTVAAYLNQVYPDDAIPLYLTLPRAVAIICNLDPKKTYRIKKYIYGLPDAGRAYYFAYREHLLEHGYTATASDPCLFVRICNGNRTYIWFHVDDTFIATTSHDEIERLKGVMRQRFEITINEEVDSHLGVSMETLPDGSVKLTQPKLLHQIFSEYPPETIPSFRGVPVPLHQVDPSQSVDDATSMDAGEYLHLLGMLNYLTRSRPDIATALSFAATHSAQPTLVAFDRLLHIVRYLWDTRDKSLIVRRVGRSGDPLTLTCFVDASYLTHIDSKSHTGYCMSFGRIGTFFVKSSKQQLVATSSTHAEVRALYQLVLDIVFVVNLCDELHRPVELPAIVMEDNQPAIDLSESLSNRVKKCKHFLMLVSYIREQVASGLIEIKKVSSENNHADMLTKVLSGASFTSKADYLLGFE